MPNIEDILPEDLQWTTEPIIGLVLQTAVHDSNYDPINPQALYDVAKHIPTGCIIILPNLYNKIENANMN